MSARKGSGALSAGYVAPKAKHHPSVSFVLGLCAAALATGLVYAISHTVAWAFGDAPNVPLTFMYLATWQATCPERKAGDDPVLDVVANWALWGVYVYHLWRLTGAL